VEADTQEWDGTKYITVKALFRKYASMADSFTDHAHFFVENARYKDALNYIDDPDEFARRIHKAGYATDPKYSDKLIELMKCYNLYQYDRPTAASTTATLLVMDVSGSMADFWQGGIKIESAKSAANQIVNMLQQESQVAGTTHRVGLTSFTTDAFLNLGLSTIYDQVRTTVGTLIPLDSTNIGAGLTVANDALAQATAGEAKIVILLSDGMTNAGLSPDQILAGPVQQAASAGTCIYTVGFGDPGNLDEDLLRRIAAGSGCGQYYYATNVSELEKIYIRIRHVSTGNLLAEISGSISQGETVQAGTFDVPAGQGELAVTLHWPGSALDLQLTDPKGRTVDQNYKGASVATYPNLVYALIQQPVAGTWQLGAYGREVPEGTTNFDAIASSRAGAVVPLPVSGSFPLVIIAVVLSGGAVALYVLSRTTRRPGPAGTPVRPVARGAAAQLIGLSGRMAGRTVTVGAAAFIIGRGRLNNLPLADPQVSRRHAVIRYAQARWFIQDQGSTGGVFVNGQRVTATALNNGDRIRIGSTEFEFRIG
jgi:Mg-chelatase subunit ChlD